jgi:hypothetical protein
METELDRLKKLQHLNKQVYAQDADRNADLRASFRTQKKARQKVYAQAKALGWRSDMLQQRQVVATNTTIRDVCRAAQTSFGKSAVQKQQDQWKRVRTGSIFCSQKTKMRKEQPRQQKRQRQADDVSSSNNNNHSVSSGTLTDSGCPDPVFSFSPSPMLQQQKKKKKRRTKTNSKIPIDVDIESSSAAAMEDLTVNMKSNNNNNTSNK